MGAFVVIGNRQEISRVVVHIVGVLVLDIGNELDILGYSQA